MRYRVDIKPQPIFTYVVEADDEDAAKQTAWELYTEDTGVQFAFLDVTAYDFNIEALTKEE